LINTKRDVVKIGKFSFLERTNVSNFVIHYKKIINNLT
jgi:hypothetical protein